MAEAATASLERDTSRAPCGTSGVFHLTALGSSRGNGILMATLLSSSANGGMSAGSQCALMNDAISAAFSSPSRNFSTRAKAWTRRPRGQDWGQKARSIRNYQHNQLIKRDIRRREWDSNPRYACTYTRFPSVRLKPLGHLSGASGFLSRRVVTRKMHSSPHLGACVPLCHDPLRRGGNRRRGRRVASGQVPPPRHTAFRPARRQPVRSAPMAQRPIRERHPRVSRVARPVSLYTAASRAR